MPPLLGKWRRFGAHDFPNEHSQHCRSFRANRLIEQGPWEGLGTFRTCRDCRVESGFGDKAEVGFLARQEQLLGAKRTYTRSDVIQCWTSRGSPICHVAAIFAERMSRAYLSFFFLMNLRNSVGDLGSADAPSSERRALMLAFPNAALTSMLSFSMTSLRRIVRRGNPEPRSCLVARAASLGSTPNSSRALRPKHCAGNAMACLATTFSRAPYASPQSFFI
jgi:hypothetical protein